MAGFRPPGNPYLDMELNANILTKNTYQAFIHEKEWAVILVDTESDIRGKAKILPTVRKSMNTYRAVVAFGQFDPEIEKDLARQTNILNIPTVLYYRRGKLVASLLSASQNVSGRIKALINGRQIGYHDGNDFI